MALPAAFVPDVRQAGLVVLAGAGVSMLAPSALPNWRDFNRAVIAALAERTARDTSRRTVEQFLQVIQAGQQVERVYAPDFMAQLIEEELGADYFRVLQVLDSERCNANHLLLAALARAGHLRAVITTNFDRLIERALDALGVAHQVFASDAEFAAIEAATTLPVIKAHGSVERPETMVDTLAQRVRGRPQALNDAIAARLRRHPLLVIGFSGADLDYDPGYLGLRAAAGDAHGVLMLVREGEEPLAPMRRLLDEFGPRAATITGSLPEALQVLAAALTVPAPPEPASSAAAAEPQAERLAQHAQAWVDSLAPMSALNAFITLVDANRDSAAMLQFMVWFRRHYRTEQHTVDPVDWSPGYRRFEFRFARRLLDVGRLVHDDADERDEARRLFGPTAEVLQLRRDEDAVNRLGNLAQQREPVFEAKAARAELALWLIGPGRAQAAAEQVCREWFQHQAQTMHDPRTTIDMCASLARVFELTGDYGFAARVADLAVEAAGQIGDEPRRALALILKARTLGLTQQPDAAAQTLAAAQRITGRLGLARITAQALAAQGLLEVLAGRDTDAIAPLTEACELLERDQRLPMLLITLLDLCRAAWYAGQGETLQSAQLRLHALCDRMPGAEAHLTLMKAALAGAGEAWDQLEKLAGALEREATRDAEYPWQWGLGRVQRFREMLASKR